MSNGVKVKKKGCNRANMPFKEVIRQKGCVIYPHPKIKDTFIVDIVDKK